MNIESNWRAWHTLVAYYAYIDGELDPTEYREQRALLANPNATLEMWEILEITQGAREGRKTGAAARKMALDLLTTEYRLR